jgi:hypothetical protein
MRLFKKKQPEKPLQKSTEFENPTTSIFITIEGKKIKPISYGF